jgi:RNA polymerase sigma-70 factor (ECF subfamily)
MGALATFLQNLRSSLSRPDGSGLTDGELLECFIARKDEAAFEALVRLHGPMVFGVCRRVAGNEADAEDAFQATFLVLVRRADTIRPRGMVGNWLYGVANNTARKAKAMSDRRRVKEREAAVRPGPAAPPPDGTHLRAVLDYELRALSDKYRVPIVLCDLEGASIREAARRLGCPPGTVGTRLVRGRRLLAARLTRHGLIFSGGAFAAALSATAAPAGVPAPLVISTVKAAAAGVVTPQVAALTEGVLRAMLRTKLTTIAAGVLAVTLTAAAVGVAAYHPAAGGPVFAAAADDKPKADKDKLDGTWVAESGEHGGKKAAEEFVQKCKIVIAGDKITLAGLVRGEKEDGVEGTFKVDPTAKPKTIDISLANREDVVGIYELDGDTLKVCLVESKGNTRPTEFGGTGQQVLIVLKRSKVVADDKPKADTDKLDGTWAAVSREHGGKTMSEELVQKCKVVISGDKITLEGLTNGRPEGIDGTFKLDPTAKPKAIDLHFPDWVDTVGIYELDGDSLKLCIVESMGNTRPTEFKGTGKRFLMVLKRAKAK